MPVWQLGRGGPGWLLGSGICTHTASPARQEACCRPEACGFLLGSPEAGLRATCQGTVRDEGLQTGLRWLLWLAALGQRLGPWGLRLTQASAAAGKAPHQAPSAWPFRCRVVYDVLSCSWKSHPWPQSLSSNSPESARSPRRVHGPVCHSGEPGAEGPRLNRSHPRLQLKALLWEAAIHSSSSPWSVQRFPAKSNQTDGRHGRQETELRG